MAAFVLQADLLDLKMFYKVSHFFGESHNSKKSQKSITVVQRTPAHIVKQFHDTPFLVFLRLTRKSMTCSW